PADVEELIQTIAAKLREPHLRRERKLLRISHILSTNIEKIQPRWLQAAKRDPELAAIPLSDKHRANHLPQVLAGIIAALESSSAPSAETDEAAREHRKGRLRQGYRIPMRVQEARLLQPELHDIITKKPHSRNVSRL